MCVLRSILQHDALSMTALAEYEELDFIIELPELDGMEVDPSHAVEIKVRFLRQ